MKIKKILSLLLAVIAVISFCSCKGKGGDASSTTEAPTETDANTPASDAFLNTETNASAETEAPDAPSAAKPTEKHNSASATTEKRTPAPETTAKQTEKHTEKQTEKQTEAKPTLPAPTNGYEKVRYEFRAQIDKNSSASAMVLATSLRSASGIRTFPKAVPSYSEKGGYYVMPCDGYYVSTSDCKSAYMLEPLNANQNAAILYVFECTNEKTADKVASSLKSNVNLGYRMCGIFADDYIVDSYGARVLLFVK